MAEVAALSCKTEQEIEQARVRLLGKKGEITALFDEFRTVAPELKREFGQKLNVLKNAAAAKIEELKEAAAESPAAGAAAFDYTMPGDPVQLGSRHPVSIAREEIVNIFRKFGYDVAEGPEVEDDWHVFEALNFPPEHPAREMFGAQSQIRMRPSYFPFTEPSAEIDVSCNICGGKGCNICKGTGWLEIMGCGMVDPNVLEASGIDSKKYSGFAFGMGVERIAMRKWQVRDLRNYFENDLRFLKEFETSL